MNNVETRIILAMIETNWQKFPNQKAAEDLWGEAFKDDPFQIVRTAVMSLINTDTGEFRPSIAKVRRKMHDIVYGERMTETEAWLLIKGSLHEAQSDPERLGGATSAWKKLPEDLQRLVSPRQLLEWNWLENSELDTVIQSNFMRSYREVRDRKYNAEALPKATAQNIEAIRKAIGLYQSPEQKPEALPEAKIMPELPERKSVEMTDKRKAMLADFIGAKQ